jgi:hypothetical protein
MKKTSVEWLGKELESYGDPGYCKIEWETLDLLIQQAKEMEKEQMHAEYMRGWKDGLIKQGPPTPPLDRKIYK